MYIIIIFQSFPKWLYFSEKEQLKAAEREIYNCNKIIWLAQSDLTEKHQECNQLNMEISSLVSECHNLEYELIKAGEKEIKRCKECEMMMNNHTVKVKELEKTLPLQVELECLCSYMEELKTHSMYVMVKSTMCR